MDERGERRRGKKGGRGTKKSVSMSLICFVFCEDMGIEIYEETLLLPLLSLTFVP